MLVVRDRCFRVVGAGGGSTVTARSHRIRVTHARDVAPYRSSECRIGSHHDCVKVKPTAAPADIPVVYEACTCACHSAAPTTWGDR